ncbi:MAG: Type IV pilus assembly protein PilB [Candidatus Woesebacteria bacterium GW2011_GWB1_39_12]|uniref:Type IV pilus assembly protein PilB n=2 Tax=Candidatus Woeseibacteriota TaxID=1752722 RepID=A0A0G0M2Y4_9BACT|nr:MAG: Type IV pilus assembly protein PilB [Candidatus Woesebacteria bacterium GW2011_GWA1_39_12]KKR00746.1 MAG: Type IV pilus assembly protein PilB [Candidatus Woesebacteria bacterium GW2011_GWB1_39_12]
MRLFSEQELFDTLKELDVIPLDKLKESFEEASLKKISLEELLVQKDLISDTNIGKIIADLINYPFVNLSETAIDEGVLNTIPEVYAKKQMVVAFKRDKEGLHIVLNDPSDKQVPDFIGKKIGIPVKTYYASKRSIKDALNLYAKDIAKVFDEIIAESVKEAKGTKVAEPSIIKIVDTIITYAYQNRSSDIHIEPTDDGSTVRFRIDGMLHDIINLPSVIHPQIVTRVKVMARLRTDEHQSAQDGKISVELAEENLDIRISIVPVTNGEKVVMRLLSERSRQFSLQDLGFSESDLKKVVSAYNKPHGMILSTGPTGSGKTTTLYAVLKLLNKRNVNIMTIEDPVEYDMEGVNQIQVNPNTNLTFAAGLKSIVRQDPDIILVGEIRDEETADISINAAMTGHLVLSTLHTNDAATAFPRLLDFGVEPFLIATTVNVVIAQRLVRKICLKCRVSEEVSGILINEISESIMQKYFPNEKNLRVYKGKGCDLCHGTGYVGRVGIFEVLLVDDEMKTAIVAKKESSEIKKIAVKNGMTTMLEDGIGKVKQGITTIDEIIRVTKE